jgi:AcrR family transcriptional regulator
VAPATTAIAPRTPAGPSVLSRRGAVGQLVGVTAMALYGYFPDKDSLLDAMADRVIDEVMGWALSEVSGRFAAGRMSLQERREQLGPDEMPARDKVAAVRDTHADPDAEFLADFTGILGIIEAGARQARSRADSGRIPASSG